MRTLTDKQLAFCQEYVVNGYNGSRAYGVAYLQENKDVCKSEAYNMLRLSNIQEGIKNAELDYRITGHGLGINKEAVIKVIKAAMSAKKVNNSGEEIGEDNVAQLKAVEVYAKLTGDFSAEKKAITVETDTGSADLSKMTTEEREAYKAKILAEL